MNSPMTRMYRNGILEAEGFPLAEVSNHLARADTVLWVDFCAPTAAQLHDLADELSLHELAVEDALGRHQRPKLDHYSTHLFLACHAVRAEPGNNIMDVAEVDAFISDRWFITVRKDEDFPMTPVLQRWDRSPDLTRNGVSFLLYGLLDVVVDTYFDAITAFDDYYDEVSGQIFAGQPLDTAKQRDWFDARRAMVRLHRLVVPMREAISSLMRREHVAVSDELYPYFQDVYDHILRVNEDADSLRDLVSTIMETNLILRDYRQNKIMKKVSSWAAIIAVPTLITGYYGMNVPYPGFGRPWAVVAASGLIVVTCVGLYRLFRRVDWL